MTKQILIPLGTRKKLRQVFGVSYPTVRDALNYKTKSKLADKIRYVAVKEYGGVTIDN